MLARLEQFQSNIDKWIQQESEGNEFPVPFEEGWEIAGYSRKDNAQRRILGSKSRFKVNKDYSLRAEEKLEGKGSAGRVADKIYLSTDCFKMFCLMAETEAGDLARQYFISAEKKWRMVQQVAPALAAKVEEMAYPTYLPDDTRSVLNGLSGLEREQALLELRPYDPEKDSLG
jgi:phage anti-repressor protein